MDDPFLVGRLQRLAYLDGDLEASGKAQCPRSADQLEQVFALDEVHGDVLDLVDLSQIVDPDDVLVGNGPAQQRFLPELIDHVGPRGKIGADHLEDDRDAEFVIFGLVDPAHPALADFFDDRIAVAELLPGIKLETLA